MSSAVVIALVVTLAAVALAWNIFSTRKRREELATLASRLGLTFDPSRDENIAYRFAFLDRLSRGTNRYAYNVVSGRFQGEQVFAFDFRYETETRDADGSRQTQDHRFSFFILELQRAFPELTIAREGLMSKVAQALGYEDIDFESAEFSSAFCVRSRDKKFGYDVCNQKMMTFLLANRDLNIEIEGRALALGFDSMLSTLEFERNLRRLVRVRTLLPQYLFEQEQAS
jgi:hypothetical protein